MIFCKHIYVLKEYLGQVLFWVRSSHFWQLWPLDLENSNNLQFSLIFFGLAAHIEMTFGIHICRRSIWIKICFGHDQAIFDDRAIYDRVTLKKIPLICSFRSFSSHWLHVLKWYLMHRLIIRMSRSSSGLGTIEPFLTELCPLDLDKFQ
jgi:hypothetical protein